MGATYGVFGSALTFGAGASDVSIERRAVSAAFDLRLSETSTLSFGAGAGLGGLMKLGASRYTILPGWLFSASYSRRLVDGRGSLPFLLLGVSGGGSGASTRELRYTKSAAPPAAFLYAFDIRVGLTVGKTFWNVISPYAAVRAFGGPVVWKLAGEARTGTDRHHYQLAAGMVSSLPRGVDLFAEIAPLGERAVTLGGGVGF